MNVQQSNKKFNQKFTSENITTYKICTATPDKTTTAYKGGIQNFYTNFETKRIGLTKLQTKQ